MTAGAHFERLVAVAVGPREVALLPDVIGQPAPGEIQVRSSLSLISSGTELMILGSGTGGAWEQVAAYPKVLGYCNVGVITDVGDGVDHGLVGTRVASHAVHASVANVAASESRAIPRDVADTQAVLSSLAEVALNGLRRAQSSIWGQQIGVIGLGLVGQLVGRLAASFGADVVGVDPSPRRAVAFDQVAGAQGIVGVASAPEMAAARNGFDLVVEASGAPDAVEPAARLVRPGGCLLMLSSPSGPSSFHFHDLCNRPSISIVGAHYFSHPETAGPLNPWTSQRHGELFLARVSEGRADVAGLVDHAVDHADLADAYEAARSAHHLGVALTW